MAELVYLKDALGNSRSYTVENGVKISDGVGGWVPFAFGGGWQQPRQVREWNRIIS